MLEKHKYIEPNILEIAILEMCRLKKDECFSPADVVKWIYPQDWRFFLSDVEEAMMRLNRSGKIVVIENDSKEEVCSLSKVSYMIKAKAKTS